MTGKKLIKLLINKGWRLDRISGSHHILIKDDKTISIPVHGNNDLPIGLLSKLLKQGEIK
jgi:predicted RNA binding protein YcfA (HicA-like mRNA interferase family)